MEKENLRIDVIKGSKARGEFLELLDSAFQVPAGSHFFDDFPIWDEQIVPPEQGIIRAGIFNDQKLISALGIRFAHLNTPGGPLPVTLVGGVVTDPSWRGRGLASQIVSLATEWAQDAGCPLIILWGSEHELYRRQGFDLCGQQVRLPLNQLETSPNPTIKIETGWNLDIFAAMKKREGGLLLKNTDQQLLEAHKNVEWFYARREGEVVAYAAIGRGIDLQGFVHEWGGEREALLEILSAIRGRHPEANLLGCPDQFTKFGFNFDPGSIEFLCLAKILDPFKVVSAFKPGFPFAAKKSDEDWNLRILGNQTIRVPAGRLGPLLFGPSDGSGKSFGAPHLPLPLWIWGLDGA